MVAWGERVSIRCRETRKALWIDKMSVPQTDTGRRGENPKASERKVVKELGKITP